jgi:hypothetical protein
MLSRPISVLVMLLVCAVVSAQSAGTMQKMLDAEGAKLRAWGNDAAVVAAVKAQNAKKVPLAQIQALDARWASSEEAKRITTGACADRLRALIASNPAYGETFVMDDQGAVVCASHTTTDYWQGDEAKWQRAFNGGKGALFIDRPKFDDSAAQRLAQISVPVMDKGVAIGAITIGVAAEKLK